MIIDVAVENLIQYAKSHLLLDDLDEMYVRNSVLDLLKVDSYTQYEIDEDAIDEMSCPDEIIAPLVSYALSNGVIKEGEACFDEVKAAVKALCDQFPVYENDIR